MDDHNLLGDFDDCFDFLHYDAFSLFGEESFDFNVESLRTNFVDTGPAPFLEHGIDPNSLNIPAPELGPISADAYSSLKASVPGESNVALAPPSHSNDLSKDSPCNNSDDTKSHAKDTAAIRRSTNSRKRKWHASMGVFPSAPGQMITLRQRRPFDASRRKEVALNRVVGACVQCKLRKSSCNFGVPCNECVKRAGTANLGQQLCTRQRLVAARFNNIDLLGVTRFEAAFEDTPLRFIAGTERDIHLFWPSCCNGDSTAFFKVRIQDFEALSPWESYDGYSQVIKSIFYSSCEEFNVPDSSCAIISGSFPCLDDVEEGYLDSDHCCNSGPFWSLHIAFGQFVRRYCSVAKELPFRDLLRKVLRMKRLLHIYSWAPMAKAMPGGRDLGYTSSWIKMQLRHQMAKKIMDIEVEVLDELDRVLHNSAGIGKRSPLAIWVCLWLLILAYRGHFTFMYWHYFHDKHLLNSVYSLTTHMYQSFVSIYAALYRTTTPLTFDWRNADISEMLGSDSELIRLFCNIKTEMFWFHAEKDRLFAEDDLLKKLVVEKESKMLESQKKMARRQGIL